MVLILASLLACQALAADAGKSAQTDSGAQTQNEKNLPDMNSREAAASASKTSGQEENGGNKSRVDETEKKDNVLECEFYTVTLPADWKAVMPPTDSQGFNHAIFSNNNGSAGVDILISSASGTDTKTIAQMFSEQFKAEKAPTEKNNQYSFSFMQQGRPYQAYVATSGDYFCVTTLMGNKKLAMNFIRNNIKSGDYSRLFPQQAF